MKDDLVPDSLLRQFLLAQVGEDERQRIERLFITGALSEERVIAVEEELIDDYLDDCLNSVDRESFLAQYVETWDQQRKLRTASSIRDWARTQSIAEVGKETRSYSWAGLRQRIQLKPFWAVPIVFASIVAMVILGIWFGQNAQERKRSLATERQIQQLNEAENSGRITASRALTLTPVSLRSAGPQAEFSAQPVSHVVELRLVWMQKQTYPTYRAVIRRVGDNRSMTIRDLRSGDNDATVRLLLPADALSSGQYEIELSAMNFDGAAGPSDEYRFAVTD